MILYYFVEFAGSFANIALLLLFIGRLFPKKEPVSKWFYVYVVLMIAGQCALSLFPDWVTQRTIYLLVGGFFLALLFYEVRPWQAVFASGAFFTLIALVEVLAMLLIGLRIPDTDILMQAGAARLVYVVFSNLIQVPLVVLISHFFSRKGNALRILWLLPIIAIQIASIAVCYVAQYHAADEYFPDYMVGLMAVLLLINILIVFYVEALRENELEKFKAKFNEQQYNLQMEYYQQLKERQEEVRSLRHDVKKYILAIFEKQIGIKLNIIGCIGALALILTGVISEKDALKSIDLKTIFLFGGTLSLASALDKTGAGAEIANIVIGALGENPSPYVLTLVVFLLCCVMTNFMSNTATTALMVPICLSIAQGMGADPRAVLMACVIGGSCAYATPIGMPANTMVVSAGGYSFKDYAKAGLPLILIATVVSMVILPIAFPFFPQ